MRRRRAAFVLAAALCLLYVMSIITLVLATQGRTMVGFTLLTQGQIWEDESASVAFSQLRGILQGTLPPATLGLPGTLTPSAPFHGNEDAVDVSGTLTFQKPAAPGGPESYASTVTASGVAVPSDHALAVLTAQIAGNASVGTRDSLCLYSANCPYGLLAPAGAITVQSVRSTSDPDGTDSHVMGLMTSVFASGGVNVTGQINGRVYSTGTSINVAQGGILYPSWPNAVAIPSDFASQLSTFKSKAPAGLTDISGKFNDLHSALHQDFSGDEAAAYAAAEAAALEMGGTLDSPLDVYGGADTTQATVNSPGSTDVSGSTLNIGVSLRIPSGESDELNFSTVNISSGDLLLEDNTVLHVKGDLTVSGAIRLGQQASLVVDGVTQAQSVEPTYSLAASYVSIRSAIYSQGALTVANGMQQTGVQWIPQLPTTTSNPYPSDLTFSVLIPDDPAFDSPDDIPNPAYVDFQGRQIADMATLTVSDNIQNYLVSIVPTGASTTDAVPGVFMVCDTAITAGNCAKMAGLFVGSGVSMPNTTHLVGAVFAPSGDITLNGTDFRYFPYFTHAFGQTASGQVTVAAVSHHPIAVGSLP